MMERQEIEALFIQFAAPLAFYIALGGRKEAAERLARSLWMAMLGGEEMEQTLWSKLQQDPAVEDGLIESLQTCYYDEMKPQIDQEQLAALRRRYGL